MSGWLALFALVGGFVFALFAIASIIGPGTLGECRAAHPGYDCELGWVVGERFE